MHYPDCLLLGPYFSACPFLLFSFSVLHFLVVVSVRKIKLTRVGFRSSAR